MSADQLAGLSIEQLQELRDEQVSDEAKAALQLVIEQREQLEQKVAEVREAHDIKPRTSQKGKRKPKGRAVPAAQTFNASPENLARLQRVMAGALQPDGTYVMTPEFIQLGIGAYYEQRRQEQKAGVSQPDTSPIIPSEDEGEEPAVIEAELSSVTASVNGDDEYDETE